MAKWTVEVSKSLAAELRLWDRGARMEFEAVRFELYSRGPEAVGLIASELEGFPPWDQIGASSEHRAVVSLRGAYYGLLIDIRPDRTLTILSAKRILPH